MIVPLLALDTQSTRNIYENIFRALSPKRIIRVYTDNQAYREILSTSKYIRVSALKEADIVLSTTEKSLVRSLEKVKSMKQKPIFFVTNFSFLKFSEEIVGAFYWKKGRSQLIFIKKRVQAKKITLPTQHHKYIVDIL